MTVKLLTDHHLEFVSLKGGCTGSSESTLVKMPHCWKSHLCVIQPVGDDTEDCRIELEPRSGVLEPREEKSITVHYIAIRTVGVHVMEIRNYDQF